MVTVEDLDGAIDVLLFPGTYQLAGSLLAEDAIVTVRGKLSRSKDQPEIRGEEVTVPDLTDDRDRPGGDEHADHPVHAAGGRPAQGGAAYPPRCDRGPPATARPRADDGDAASTTGCGWPPGAPLFADLKQLLGPGCLSG